MNDDLIKPDANKPVVPDMDNDIPSISPEDDSLSPQETGLPKSSLPGSGGADTPSPAAEPPKAAVVPQAADTSARPTTSVPPASPISPALPSQTPLSSADTPLQSLTNQHETGRKSWARMLLIVLVGLLLLASAGYALYKVGNSRGYKNGQKAMSAEMSAQTIKIPQNATMVAQCAVGEGTQYVLPSDIPQGPIYNVWNNKVTGIEFMLAQSKIAANKTLDLALKSQKYDHIDVMYEAAGHAGFTEPHYHIVLSMIPFSDEQKITCSSNSSSSSDSSSSHDSHDMSSMGM
jgi:hypothetical protein